MKNKCTKNKHGDARGGVPSLVLAFRISGGKWLVVGCWRRGKTLQHWPTHILSWKKANGFLAGLKDLWPSDMRGILFKFCERAGYSRNLTRHCDNVLTWEFITEGSHLTTVQRHSRSTWRLRNFAWKEKMSIKIKTWPTHPGYFTYCRMGERGYAP